jgi:hypothetical protein
LYFNILITLFLLLWLISAIFSQGKQKKILRFDFLGLIPNCRFFAPRPISRDLNVYARGLSTIGETTPWKPIFFTKKPWYCFIWNPHQRLRKILLDLLQQLQRFRDEKDTWHISFPYLTLLYTSTHLFNKNPNMYSVQFMIACHAGYEEDTNDILFLSNIHRIEKSI